MSKKMRSVLLAVVMMMLCVSLIAGGTYALFTDKVILTNHLQAANLNITLKRTNLTSKTLNTETGFLVSREFAEDVDFTGETDKNVFEVSGAELIVPGCEWNAEMQILNGSDVAFGYWIEIDFLGGSGVLAEQMKVIVTPQGATEPTEAWMNDGNNVGSEQKPISVLAKGGSQFFTVKVAFVDDKTNGANFVNNDAMGDNVKFDLIVHAVQATSAP